LVRCWPCAHRQRPYSEATAGNGHDGCSSVTEARLARSN
jgi:hypothetical protein